MKTKYYSRMLPVILFFCVFAYTPASAQNSGKTENSDPLMMSFQTHAKIGNGTIEQKNQLSVLISTNFSGDYTDKAIRKAKWQNITDRFTLSPVIVTDELLSTSADISDLVQKGKPFHIAFKYETPSQTTEKRYVTWKVRNFQVSQTNSSDTLHFVKREPLTLYHKGTQEPGRTVAFNTQVIFRGNLKKANFADPTEDWAISAAITVP